MSNIYQWIGGSDLDNFGDPANWIDETTGITGDSAPGPGDTADLVGAGFIGGTGTVAALNVSDTTSNGLTIGAGSVTATAVSVDGGLTLDDGTTLASATVTVGSSNGTLGLLGSDLMPLGGALNLTVSSIQQEIVFAAVYTASNTEIDLGTGTAIIGSGSGQYGSLNLGGTLLGGIGSVLDIGQDAGAGLASFSGPISTSGSIVVGDGGTGALFSEYAAPFTAGSGSGTALVVGRAGNGNTPVSGSVDFSTSDATLNGLTEIGEGARGSLSATLGSLTTTGGVVLGVNYGSGTLSLGSGETWTDTGNVIVGASGFGSLFLDNFYSPNTSASIDGNLLVGTGIGPGTVVVEDEVLTVTGSTTLGSLSDVMGVSSISVEQGGTLDSAGETLTLLPGPYDGGAILSLTDAGSALVAGGLIVGNTDDAGFGNGTTGTIGTSLSGTAIDLQGALSIGAATVKAKGAVDVTGAQSGSHGLMSGGTLAITASGPALSISDFGMVTSQTGGLLTATGGIVIDGPGSTLALEGGTVEAIATGTGPALQISSSATVAVGGGALTTVGNLDVGASGSGQLIIYPGEGGQVDVGGTLEIGSAAGTGFVSTDGDVAITGSGIASNTASIAAASLAMTGAGSSLDAGTLTVGTGKTAAVVSMAGGTLSATGTIIVAHGARIHGGGTLQAADIVDMGRIQVNHGTMSCLGTVTGNGQLNVQRGDMILAQGEGAGVGLVFSGFGTFTVASVASISGTLSGWGRGDAIDFTGQAIASATFSGHTLSLFAADGSLIGKEIFAGSYARHNFALSSDHGSGTLLTYHA